MFFEKKLKERTKEILEEVTNYGICKYASILGTLKKELLLNNFSTSEASAIILQLLKKKNSK